MPSETPASVPTDNRASFADAPVHEQESGWVSWSEPRDASYVELTDRLARADLQLCELQAHMDELIEANCRLRADVSAMTLQWVIDKTKA